MTNTYPSGRPRPLGVDLFGPRRPAVVAPAGTSLAQMTKAIDEYARLLAAATSTPRRTVAAPAAPQLKRGDKVRVAVEAYVKSVDSDGLITVSDTREPFDASTLFARLQPSTVTLVEAAPQPVKVGDAIGGDRIRETPWKRGTVIAFTDPVANGRTTRWVLKRDGRWVNLNTGTDRPFSAFMSAGQYVVEHAPGKATA